MITEGLEWPFSFRSHNIGGGVPSSARYKASGERHRRIMPFLRFTAGTQGLPVPHLTVKVRSKFDMCIDNSKAFVRGENGPRRANLMALLYQLPLPAHPYGDRLCHLKLLRKPDFFQRPCVQQQSASSTKTMHHSTLMANPMPFLDTFCTPRPWRTERHAAFCHILLLYNFLGLFLICVLMASLPPHSRVARPNVIWYINI